MPRLQYNLNEIESREEIPAGRYKAKLKACKKKKSRSGKPMLEWQWKLTSGSAKNQTVMSWTSLQENALFSLKEHLEALGLKGQVDKSTDQLVGKIAVVVVGHLPTEDEESLGFPVVNKVMPKNTPLNPKTIDEDDDDLDEDDEFEDEEDEDEEELEDEEEDEDEEEYDEDDEEEDEEDEDEEEEPAPKRRRSAKKRR